MSQATFDDEDLFGEAAAEMREEVEGHLADARAELPTADAVWECEADNTLGALNALKSALTVGEAADRLRQAKKSYVLGERADAFEDADDLATEIEDLSDLLDQVETAGEEVTSLAGTIPQLRGALEDAHAGADSEGEDEEESEAEEADAESDDANEAEAAD